MSYQYLIYSIQITEGRTNLCKYTSFFWEWRRLVRNNPLSPRIYSDLTSLKPATELFGIDVQLPTVLTNANSKYSIAVQKSFSKLLGRLRPEIKNAVTLQSDPGDDGIIEGQTYTGIVV